MGVPTLLEMISSDLLIFSTIRFPLSRPRKAA
jgi:hypothetical protein